MTPIQEKKSEKDSLRRLYTPAATIRQSGCLHMHSE